jgi:NAD(P)-dependent dehydrogenase (short-subunit alcohol dehydrogenase family)
MSMYGGTCLLPGDFMHTPAPKMRDPMRQNVLLVGGTKGLGKAIHETLTASEHRVRSLSRSGSLFVLDLSWPEGRIKHHIDLACENLDQVDTLIVTAGMGSYDPPWVSDDKVQELFRVNVLGPMAVFRALQRRLLKSKGKAIFITSTAARRPGSGGLSYYASTKGAMHSWIISEGRRQIKHGVAMCAVAPGFFDSPMTEKMVPALRRATEKAIPAGRYGKDWEIATFVSDLLWQSNWVLAGQIYGASGGA